MEYPYFKGLEADRYSFYRVPKALVKADLFQKMSGDAKLLYAVLLDRMSLSIKNGWQDKHGKPLVRSAQPDTRFAFVRLHRACYPLTERRCSP